MITMHARPRQTQTDGQTDGRMDEHHANSATIRSRTHHALITGLICDLFVAAAVPKLNIAVLAMHQGYIVSQCYCMLSVC